jgi:hypothetical protein
VTESRREWLEGYSGALHDAIELLNKECRWQTELNMRGDAHARAVTDRIGEMAEVLKVWQNSAVGCAAGEAL